MSDYYQSIMSKVLIFGLFAMSLDIIFGYTGLYSLGHAAFFGVAGYVTGIMTVKYGLGSFWISTPIGILAAAFTSALFGIIALRVSSIYFLLVTFALGQLLFSISIKWYSMTMGRSGFIGIPRPDIGLPWLNLLDPLQFYYFVLLIFTLCYFLLSRLVNSPFGNALQGIREAEPRMRTLGYNVWLYKYMAYIIAGLFAGVSGILFGYFNGSIAPSHIGFSNSALVMLMVILGGAGTLWGPAVGAGIIILLQSFISLIIPERWPLVLGGVFVLAVMYFRGGIGLQLHRFKSKLLPYGSNES